MNHEQPDQTLSESERRELRHIEIQLACVAGLLHVMTGTVQDAQWQAEDALLNDQHLDDYLLSETIDILEADLKQIQIQSNQAVTMLRNYRKQPTEEQAALNALHNAGMLPPQEEPPGTSPTVCAGEVWCGEQRCIGPCTHDPADNSDSADDR